MTTLTYEIYDLPRSQFYEIEPTFDLKELVLIKMKILTAFIAALCIFMVKFIGHLNFWASVFNVTLTIDGICLQLSYYSGWKTIDLLTYLIFGVQ